MNVQPLGILLLILYNFPIKATTAENDIKMMSTRMQLYTRRSELKLNIRSTNLYIPCIPMRVGV